MKRLLVFLTSIIMFMPLAAFAQGTTFEDLVLDVIKKNPQVIKEILQKYEQDIAEKQKEDEFKNLLQDRAEVEIDKSPIRGNKKAKYTVIAFSDFQCPFCKRGDDTVKELMEKYGDDMRYVFKNFPLGFHSEAAPAAKACFAAGQQGKFYEYHDKLFENQGQLGADLYVKIAEELNLNIDKFNKDRNSAEAQAYIDEDMAQGQKAGIRGTPGFLLNGVKIFGAYPVEHFEKVISALSKDENKAANNN